MTETYRLGAVVPLRFEVRDEDTGELADPTSWSVTITSPIGTFTPTVEHTDVGVFDVDYVSAVVGPHTATFTASGEHADVVDNVFVVTPNPVLSSAILAAEIREYLGGTSETDQTLLNALAAERVDQANKCRIDNYTEALREALLRRVARNLAARRVPVATMTSFDGGATSTRVPRTDPEILRLEGPYRRNPVG